MRRKPRPAGGRTPGSRAASALRRCGHVALSPKAMYVWSQTQWLTRALGYPPSYRELCVASGLSLNGAMLYVKELRDAGLLEPQGHQAHRTFFTRYRLERYTP